MGLHRSKPPEEIARNMSAIRSTDNLAERRLRQCLHRHGLRFRKYARTLDGRPDIVFPAEQVAVFVDGDYWHARLLREKGRMALESYFRGNPRSAYWIAKFERRALRDSEVNETLRRRGWSVLRFWESDVKRDPLPALQSIVREVAARRGDYDRLAQWEELPAEDSDKAMLGELPGAAPAGTGSSAP